MMGAGEDVEYGTVGNEGSTAFEGISMIEGEEEEEIGDGRMQDAPSSPGARKESAKPDFQAIWGAADLSRHDGAEDEEEAIRGDGHKSEEGWIGAGHSTRGIQPGPGEVLEDEDGDGMDEGRNDVSRVKEDEEVEEEKEEKKKEEEEEEEEKEEEEKEEEEEEVIDDPGRRHHGDERAEEIDAVSPRKGSRDASSELIEDGDAIQGQRHEGVVNADEEDKSEAAEQQKEEKEESSKGGQEERREQSPLEEEEETKGEDARASLLDGIVSEVSLEAVDLDQVGSLSASLSFAQYSIRPNSAQAMGRPTSASSRPASAAKSRPTSAAASRPTSAGGRWGGAGGTTSIGSRPTSAASRPASAISAGRPMSAVGGRPGSPPEKNFSPTRPTSSGGSRPDSATHGIEHFVEADEDDTDVLVIDEEEDGNAAASPAANKGTENAGGHGHITGDGDEDAYFGAGIHGGERKAQGTTLYGSPHVEIDQRSGRPIFRGNSAGSDGARHSSADVDLPEVVARPRTSSGIEGGEDNVTERGGSTESGGAREGTTRISQQGLARSMDDHNISVNSTASGRETRPGTRGGKGHCSSISRTRPSTSAESSLNLTSRSGSKYNMSGARGGMFTTGKQREFFGPSNVPGPGMYAPHPVTKRALGGSFGSKTVSPGSLAWSIERNRANPSPDLYSGDLLKPISLSGGPRLHSGGSRDSLSSLSGSNLWGPGPSDYDPASCRKVVGKRVLGGLLSTAKPPDNVEQIIRAKRNIPGPGMYDIPDTLNSTSKGGGIKGGRMTKGARPDLNPPTIGPGPGAYYPRHTKELAKVVTCRPPPPKKLVGRPVANPSSANFPGPAQYDTVGHTIASRVSLRPMTRGGLGGKEQDLEGRKRRGIIGKRADPVIYGKKRGGRDWVSVNDDARAIMGLEEQLVESSRLFEETLERFISSRSATNA